MFSVELWQEIFDYFHLNDLWYSFHGLNQHINAIIDRTIVHLNFEQQDSYDYFVDNILPSINITNIRSLKLQNAFEIHDFFSIYSLESLQQIQFLSLNFRYYDDNTPFQFWNQLSSLKYLQSLKIIHHQRYWSDSNYEEKNLIFYSIFSENCCPSLKSLSVRTGGLCCRSSIPSLIPTSATPHIEYLSIDVSTFEDLSKLFFALQHLKSFHINFFQLYSDQNYDKQWKDMMVLTPIMPNCIRLHLNLPPHMSFKHVKYLLRQTPDLQYFILSRQKHLLKARRWEKLLL
ncbi:unnamed protein product [Adineta steineri]|uniref:F-box domain-containing protein n=1 Tax=Adineta steineri TaxID=433720 RepID=A0A819TLT1_9BILA|nr:unnamed protein product [Adineta steineri]